MLLNYSYSILTSIVKHNHYDFDYHGLVMLFDCTSIMVSPATYEEWILPYEQEIYRLVKELGQKFGMHHCGIFDGYSVQYRKIPQINLLEIGWGSDINAALELFPEAIVQYIFSSTFAASSNREEIREKSSQILEVSKKNWDRFRLSVPDIEFGTPDENLIEIYECFENAS